MLRTSTSNEPNSEISKEKLYLFFAGILGSVNNQAVLPTVRNISFFFVLVFVLVFARISHYF
jgi:hypothetical protein